MRRERLAKSLVARGFSTLMQYLHGYKTPDKEGQGVALMTSQNPGAKQLPDEENKARYEDLISELDRMGLQYWRTKGKYSQEEDSVAVNGITEEQARALGERYGQESVIWSGMIDGKKVDRMVYTKPTKDGAPDLENVSPLINDANGDDYYTELKGRKFRIPFYDPEKRERLPDLKEKKVVRVERPRK